MSYHFGAPTPGSEARLTKRTTTKRRTIPDEALEAAARVLRVLSHRDRMRMVELLVADEYSVSELAEAVGLPAAAVSQHLNHMAAHGIVEGERVERQVFYRVVSPNARYLIGCIRKHCGLK